MMLFTCTKHLFANADKRGAYSKLSVLLGAENLEQLFCGTAEYLHWIIHEIKQSVYTNSYMVHRVISAVSTDCARPWTIEGLAAELKISPYYLSHLFKEYTGSNFTDYLAERRSSGPSSSCASRTDPGTDRQRWWAIWTRITLVGSFGSGAAPVHGSTGSSCSQNSTALPK